MRLAESERKVMDVLWTHGEMTAKEVAGILTEQLNWSKTTTYTMLTRCINKKYIARRDPHFYCAPVLTKEQVSCWETDELIKNYFDGSAKLLTAALISRKKLSKQQIEELYHSMDAFED